MVIITPNGKYSNMVTQLQNNVSAIRVFIKRNNGKKFVFVYTDISVDCDDKQNLFGIVRQPGWVYIIITCGKEPIKKAQYAQGIVNLMGLNEEIFVVAGTDCNVKDEIESHQFEDLPFTLAPENEIEKDWKSVVRLSLIASADNDAIVLSIGPMTDLQNFLFQFTELCNTKIRTLIIQGGVKEWQSDFVSTETKPAPSPVDCDMVRSDWTTPLPNTANNNTFDATASSLLYPYAFLARMSFETYVVTREAAMAIAWSTDDFEQLVVDTNQNPLAKLLRDKQVHGLRSLWRKTCSPAGSDVRGSLAVPCNQNWYNKVFCKGGLSEEFLGDNGINLDPTPYIVAINPYDAICSMVAVSLYGVGLPAFEDMFTLYTQEGMENFHLIGLSSKLNGIVNADLTRSKMIEIITHNLFTSPTIKNPLLIKRV